MATGLHSTFEFDEALAVCRGLWGLAGQVETTDHARRAAGARLMQTFQGRYARDTDTSLHNASTTAHHVAEGFRQEARLIAGRWADEWLKEANARRQDAINEHESHRSVLGGIKDSLFGGEHYGSRPHRPPVPAPPLFSRTATIPSYHF